MFPYLEKFNKIALFKDLPKHFHLSLVMYW